MLTILAFYCGFVLIEMWCSTR